MSNARTFVVITGNVPAEALPLMLKVLRAFDITTPDCDLHIVVSAPDQKTEEVEEMVRGITPPFADILVVGKR